MPPPAEGADHPGGAARVLVVDDDPAMLKTFERMLRFLGYQPVTAESGAEAVRLLGERPGAFAAVLLDYMMPGMDGRDTYRSLKALDPAVRVLLVSGYCPEGSVESLLEEGVRGFLPKPFTSAELRERLADLVAGEEWPQPAPGF